VWYIQSMAKKCKKHLRYSCYSCKDDNAGDVSVNTDGGLSVGLGGGLAIDPSDGSLGVQVGGITIDMDFDND
jgi:hypothetical protein